MEAQGQWLKLEGLRFGVLGGGVSKLKRLSQALVSWTESETSYSDLTAGEA